MRLNNLPYFKDWKSRGYQHISFWLLSFYVLLKVFQLNDTLGKIDFIYTSMFMLGLVGVVYTNVLYLIPRFLVKRSYFLYGLTSLMMISGWTFFNILLFNDLIDFVFPAYYFIAYYEFTDIFLFTLTFYTVSTLLKLSKSWFRMIELEKQSTVAELETLKMQLNPHFLFNSMNNIHAMAIKSADKTQALVRNLSDLLRFMLYETSDDFVPMEKELEFIKNYIELQKVRVDDGSKLKLEIKGETQNKKIAPLLLLPLIENAFKHGLKGEVNDSFINIEISIDKSFSFVISNNKGELSSKEKGKGIGLNNVRRRLELLYPKSHQFNIHDKEDTFKVELVLNKL